MRQAALFIYLNYEVPFTFLAWKIKVSGMLKKNVYPETLRWKNNFGMVVFLVGLKNGCNQLNSTVQNVSDLGVTCPSSLSFHKWAGAKEDGAH